MKNDKNEDYLSINIGTKKILKVIYNIKNGISSNFKDMRNSHSIITSDINGDWCPISNKNTNIKKEYDGSYTFTIDFKNQNYKDYIRIQHTNKNVDLIITYLTIELEESYTSLDYNVYKAALSASNY